ncbi:hypothetical protein BO70DRAFT_298282 [Aspergillus heteromorphus CBS 117.55]|uniref:CENP-Q, a CENPA-CAD centromere complex subunit-domain-containing protein n=1 Tax=Aspergillus heteromorphus CBS 117.55 TaxID=1448321 RepID=A0A317VDZ6_9EURO|nr:uncharacterized protein BO70DRAFT_298282 [Aspergillus heteromorphus CBS 117.55]PWY71659.1 hypothetical protein BO70DRAFT_298282 [Aspergillus heteromorphus CBS 117.55]
MPPKRKRSSNGPEQASNVRSKRYAYLKPQVRQVSERTIKSKWSTLPEPVQDKVRDMFRALERPVIVRQQNENKRIEAQAAVQAVVKNLGKRLPRMPFPPVTKDSVFEYEAALKEHCSLEATLATMTDSIDLLKTEVEKEEALLEREKKQLHEMEKNAKRAETDRKRQSKKEHPVLRHLSKVPSDQDKKQVEFSLSHGKDSQTMFDELENDPDVSSLLKQLNGHLRSMQNNTTPLTGLTDAIARSHAALSLTFMPED